MTQTNLDQQIKNIISSIKIELDEIRIKQQAYSDSFPQSIKLGITSFDTDKKAITKAYYLFAASLANSIVKMEKELSSLTIVMREADKQLLTNRVILCDSLLSDYEDFRKNLSIFMSDSESAVLSENTSGTRAFNILTEFNRRIKLYSDMLNSISF